MLYKVYVLYATEHDKLFTGMTTSLSDRMEAHNSDVAEDWTTAYKPWTLIHMELFNSESDAIIRESFLESEGGQQYLRENVLPLFEFA